VDLFRGPRGHCRHDLDRSDRTRPGEHAPGSGVDPVQARLSLPASRLAAVSTPASCRRSSPPGATRCRRQFKVRL
jgi:hypothetical protein